MVSSFSQTRHHIDKNGLNFISYNFDIEPKTGPSDDPDTPRNIIIGSLSFLIGAQIACEMDSKISIERAYAEAVCGIIQGIEERYTILRVV